MVEPTYEDARPGDLLVTPLTDSVIIGTPTPDMTKVPGFEHLESWEAAPGVLTYRRSAAITRAQHGYFERLNGCSWRPGNYQPERSNPTLSRKLLEFAKRDIQDPTALNDVNNSWITLLDLAAVKNTIDALLV
jgi:hypothetical protein